MVVLTSGAQGVTLLGNDTVIGGSGSDTISAAAGNVSVSGGSGALIFFGGSGEAALTLRAGAAAQLALGGPSMVNMAGAASATGGMGADIYNFANGSDGTAVINNFRIGTDSLRLTGFADGTEQQVAAAATDSTGGTLLVLPDGTQIALTGVHGVSTSIFG